jgi:hypothetical protein
VTTGDAPPAAVPPVTFIVPVRNDAGRLERCLASIHDVTYVGPKRLLVADNGSTDDSPAVARRAGAQVLSLPRVSVARLRNEAAACVPDGVLAFVDADHVVDAGWLTAAVQSLGRPGVGAVGMAYLSPPGGTWVQRAYDLFRSRPDGVVAVDWLGSGNLALWKSAFDAVQGFDATLETCEDVDLCNRLRHAGYRLLSDDRMRSVHSGDPAALRAVFFGELWRGRDNIRVTLRGPLTLRALPSVLVPVLNLGGLALATAGAATAAWLGPGMLVAGLGVFGLTSLLRAVRMASNDRSGRSIANLPSNLAVGAVYECARALALVVRATHTTRRQRAGGETA